MKYSGSSIVTTYQVGGTVYIIEGDIPRVCTVSKTESTKVGSGSVTLYYYLTEFPGRKFPSAEIFVSLAAAKSYFDSLGAV